MADFTDLPVDEGVGDWHFNRFRMAFEPPKNVTPVILAANLLARFPTYIGNPNSDYATAKWGDHDYGDLKTVHFHGYAKYIGIDFAQPHSDWVAIVSLDPNAVGFTVQTLKREFTDIAEDGETGGIAGGLLLGPLLPVVGIIGAVAGIGGAAHYNRMHFLAGRRAWRIDNGSVFGLSDNVMVLETSAVERFSAEVYNVADSVIGMEKKLPDVWLAFLNNFVDLNGLKRVDQAQKPRWKKASRAMYCRFSFDDYLGLRGDPEFLNAYKLYPRILD
jgi:hypothetical protein